MKKHLIFYDGDCPLCNRVVRYVLAVDRKKMFYFAPLQGKTADNTIKAWKLKHPEADTIVLIENFQGKTPQLWIEGKAVFKILWLLGGKYRLLGWLSFLPIGPFNLMYRWIASRRYQLFSKIESLPKDPERFLP